MKLLDNRLTSSQSLHFHSYGIFDRCHDLVDDVVPRSGRCDLADLEAGLGVDHLIEGRHTLFETVDVDRCLIESRYEEIRVPT